MGVVSTNLYWRPAPKDQPKPELLSGIKHLLARRLWDHDGSLHGDVIQVGPELLPYLEGIRDGGSGEIAEDADCLIDAIRRHGIVELWIAE